MRIHLLLSVGLLLLLNDVSGQNLYTYFNREYDMEVQATLYSSRTRFHTAIQAWRIGDIEKIANYDSLTQVNRLERTIEKKWKQKAWDKFLNDDVVTLYREKFWFAVNPLMNFDIGYEVDEERSRYVNTRGFEAKGEIGKGFSFYTSFYENQATFVNYLDSNIRATTVVPGQGKVRAFKDDGFDYAYATGYIAWNAGKYFDFQLGYDRNFIGDGYRSLLLSDNPFVYPFLKITAKFWHINYMVMYAQGMDINFKWSDDLGFAKKWTTTHYLSWAASKRFSIGIFESVIWQTQDSTGYRGFDVGYLSPIIFLRPVEFSNGSPDNVLIGLNMSFIVGRHSTFYGQLILDEFKLSEWRNNNGWWGNKFGWQLGFKSFDLFRVKNLFFQTEFNWVRPYTYAHERAITNYGHYNAPIAHPLGANFWESISMVKYNYRRFYFRYQFQYAYYGLDYDDQNFGKNIYEPYTTRVSDYDIRVGQGLATTVIYNDLTVSWLINPAYNLNIALGLTYRTSNNDQGTVNTTFIHFGLRTSLNRFYYDL
jgi:hypothetical protein